jgi:hypothetical protein
MSRTRLIPALAGLVFLTLASPPAHAITSENKVDGIGLIDYSTGKPDFHVGSWVKYRLRAKSDKGFTDDYSVTILIAGEERFWGDDCFWVETSTEIPGQGAFSQATLMSYSIFADTLALPHMQVYMRKMISGLNEDGSIQETVYERVAETLQSRNPPGYGVRWNLVPLPPEAVKTPKGTFMTHPVRMESGAGSTSESPDSTRSNEARDYRSAFYTPKIPITHMAQMYIDYSVTTRSWLIGHSKDAGPPAVLDKSHGVAELIDFGDSGLKAHMLPLNRQVSLTGSKHRSSTARPAGRTTGTRKPS